MTLSVPELPLPMNYTEEPDHALAIAIPLIIATAALFMRLYVPLSVDFPLNDGGLFYRMILDLEANGLVPPRHTSYNLSSIPFAYPPLGLYAAAMAQRVTAIDLLDILRVLPPLLACVCLIPAWKIICRLQSNPVTRVYSFAFYALSYQTYEWAIMGGGITRAPGMLFALIAILLLLRCSESGKFRDALGCGVSCGLTILSHPNASLLLLASFAALIVFHKARPTFRACVLIAFSAGLVFLPWLASLIDRGLLGTFAEAAATGNFEAASMFRLIEVLFIGFPAHAVVMNVLALLGILRSLLMRHWYALAWFTLVYLTPRLSSFYTMLPLALLAGYGGLTLHEFITARSRVENQSGDSDSIARTALAPTRILFAVVVASLLSNSVVKTVHLGTTILTKRMVAEYSKLALETSESSQFIVVTNGNVHHHHLTEWFPAFSQRRSLLTPEGMEWVDARRFYEILKLKADLFRMIDDPMHQSSPELAELFNRADYLLVDSQSRFKEIEQTWQPLKEFDGLTLYSRRG